MDQPQSESEVELVRVGLQGLDPLLDVRWEPKAFVSQRGTMDVYGRPKGIIWAGRWQVIRYNTPNMSDRRDYSILCTVTKPEMYGGIPCMVAEGRYVPLGDWLVEFMRAADAANVAQFDAIRDRLHLADDLFEANEEKLDEAQAEDRLDRMHSAGQAGGVGNWQGRGADFRAMEQASQQRGLVSP